MSVNMSTNRSSMPRAPVLLKHGADAPVVEMPRCVDKAHKKITSILYLH